MLRLHYALHFHALKKIFKVCVCVCVHCARANALGGQKILDSVELELSAVVSCPAWMLGSEPGSFERADFIPEPPLQFHSHALVTLYLYSFEKCQIFSLSKYKFLVGVGG